MVNKMVVARIKNDGVTCSAKVKRGLKGLGSYGAPQGERDQDGLRGPGGARGPNLQSGPRGLGVLSGTNNAGRPSDTNNVVGPSDTNNAGGPNDANNAGAPGGLGGPTAPGGLGGPTAPGGPGGENGHSRMPSGINSVGPGNGGGFTDPVCEHSSYPSGRGRKDVGPQSELGDKEGLNDDKPRDPNARPLIICQFCRVTVFKSAYPRRPAKTSTMQNGGGLSGTNNAGGTNGTSNARGTNGTSNASGTTGANNAGEANDDMPFTREETEEDDDYDEFPIYGPITNYNSSPLGRPFGSPLELNEIFIIPASEFGGKMPDVCESCGLIIFKSTRRNSMSNIRGPGGARGPNLQSGPRGLGVLSGTNNAGRPSDTNNAGEPSDTNNADEPSGTNIADGLSGTNNTGGSSDANKAGGPIDANNAGGPGGTDNDDGPGGTDNAGGPSDTNNAGGPSGTDNADGPSATNNADGPSGTDIAEGLNGNNNVVGPSDTNNAGGPNDANNAGAPGGLGGPTAPGGLGGPTAPGGPGGENGHSRMPSGINSVGPGNGGGFTDPVCEHSSYPSGRGRKDVGPQSELGDKEGLNDDKPRDPNARPLIICQFCRVTVFKSAYPRRPAKTSTMQNGGGLSGTNNAGGTNGTSNASGTNGTSNASGTTGANNAGEANDDMPFTREETEEDDDYDEFPIYGPITNYNSSPLGRPFGSPLEPNQIFIIPASEFGGKMPDVCESCGLIIFKSTRRNSMSNKKPNLKK